MIRIGIRRQIPICLLLVVVVVLACLRSACLGRSHISSKMAATLQGWKGTRPTNAVALESSPYCLGSVFFLGRGKVVQKWSFSPRG